MKTARIDIEGMSCGHCVASVKSALDTLAGVTTEDVSIGRADVHYDPAQTGASAIEAALDEAGYPAKLVELGA